MPDTCTTSAPRVPIPKAFQHIMRETWPEDIPYLADNLRDIDKKEIAAITGCAPLDSLTQGFAISNPCFTFVHPRTREPLGMGGLCAGGAVVWMLLHKDLMTNPFTRRAFTRYSKPVRDWLLSLAPEGVMGNVCLPENRATLRWLRWLGATTEMAHSGLNPANEPLDVIFFTLRKEAGDVCVL